jgi:hypothetical protein
VRCHPRAVFSQWFANEWLIRVSENLPPFSCFQLAVQKLLFFFTENLIKIICKNTQLALKRLERQIIEALLIFMYPDAGRIN